jgi:hypothetical protein
MSLTNGASEPAAIICYQNYDGYRVLLQRAWY